MSIFKSNARMHQAWTNLRENNSTSTGRISAVLKGSVTLEPVPGTSKDHWPLSNLQCWHDQKEASKKYRSTHRGLFKLKKFVVIRFCTTPPRTMRNFVLGLGNLLYKTSVPGMELLDWGRVLLNMLSSGFTLGCERFRELNAIYTCLWLR